MNSSSASEKALPSCDLYKGVANKFITADSMLSSLETNQTTANWPVYKTLFKPKLNKILLYRRRFIPTA
tara:strand:- start:1043 stop:1249 length:207 start_codon:yes stop_codon:yes gene_type:complete